jgi:hypothetical protein
MKFNINEYVYVCLTPSGKAALEKQYNELFNNSVLFLTAHPYTPPIEDDNGWSKWQLHHLMSELGHLCTLGSRDLPFETTIRIGENND